ncbi:F-box domain-containing protein [Mycena chlorophos]|uniref:F-box domain-containing protein n=1 Tax=Mycena chlorophos TaxID=658473 RepID=A0A8H6S869_MYCCL|nr:F-box domain-containing protein [Mycena chlorophos]
MAESTAAALRTHLDDISQRILEQKQLLAQLQAYENQVRSELHRVASYPILDLPPEILSEVFINCLPDPDNISANVHQAPLLLMAVCRTWARIALATPALWESLEISGYEWEDQDLLDVMDLWFRGPLTRRLSLTGEIEPSELPRFMETFVKHSAKMAFLSVDLAEATFPLFKKYPLIVPELLELQLSGTNHAEVPERFVVIAPKLKEVQLDAIYPCDVALPWNQLTKLTLQSYSFLHLFDALRLAPNISHLEVTVSDIGNERIPTQATVTLPNIRHLRLVQVGSARPQIPILHFLALPNLEYLETNEPSIDETFLGAFVVRSAAPPLKTLRFHPYCTSTKLLIMVLHSMSQLVELEMRFPPQKFVTKFFERFPVEVSLLPNLCALSVVCRERGSEVSLVELTRIMGPAVYQRNANPKTTTKIQSLRLEVSAPPWAMFQITESYLKPYQRLRDEGLDIYLGTQDAAFEAGGAFQLR